MRRYGLYWLLVVVCLALVLALPRSPAAAAPTSATPVTLFTIPVGSEGVTYEHVAITESENEGPAALTVAPDGSFWIADTPTSRLLHYGVRGERLGIIDLGTQAVGITDLVVTERAIFALDIAAGTPAILQVTPKGRLVAHHEVPQGWQLADGLTGIALGEQGEVLLERHFGATVATFLTAEGQRTFQLQEGYIQQGRGYVVHPPDLNDPALDVTRGSLTIAGRAVAVETTNMLGGLSMVGFKGEGAAYVRVEEVVVDGEGRIQTDQTVRLYDVTGKQQGLTRVPLTTEYIYAEHGLAVGPRGDLFLLATRPDHVAIQQLPLVARLDALLPDGGLEGENPFAAPANTRPTTNVPTELGDDATLSEEPEACVSGWAMHLAAYVSAVQEFHYNNTNVWGSCTGRTRPDWLTGPGTYRGIPYDWGGWDNADQMGLYMYGGRQAGDASSGGVYACSRGMDCSGFVSVAWYLPTKYSTSSLPSISSPVSGFMMLGDILNKAGDHVVMFLEYRLNGVNVAESTTGAFDRVVVRDRSWSSVGAGTGYIQRHYHRHCGYY